MAKSGGWRDRVDKNPESAWKEAGKPKVDPAELAKAAAAARREKVMSGLDGVIAALDKGETSVRGWLDAKGEKFKLTIRLGNKVVPIDGHPFLTGPKAEASMIAADIRADVEAGNLDKEIEAAGGGAGTTRKASTGARGGGWSEERKEAYRAKMAGIYEQRRKAKAG